MASITRRQLLKGSGASLIAVAAASLAACAANETPEPQAREATAAPAPETSAELKLNDDKLIDRSCFVGVDEPVELADGTKTPMINFDNAATTPALSTVVTEVIGALPLYGSIGRGKGQKSAASTARFNDARQVVLDFFGAPADTYTCCFTGTATDALNKVSGALVTSPDDVVLTTRSEHHANDLPWREKCEVRYVEVDENGRLIMDQFQELLADGKVTVVSCQAASNVTGYVHDVHAIASMAHAAGALMVVDGAQIAAHRAFSLKGDTPDQDIDFFVTSAHKMYAPFGGGCLIGRTDVLNEHLPRYRGGGMVDVVLDEDVTWLDAPDRYEAGSPNFLGQIALATAIEAFGRTSFDAIVAHEQRLLKRAIEGLSAIPDVTLYADSTDYSDRVGIVTFNVRDIPAIDVAQKLSDNYAIAVRQGEFCAHPLCHRLMGFTDADIQAAMQKPDFEPPAMIRCSFGMYNTDEEVDVLIKAIEEIAAE